jgi:hypothetical protein
VLPSSPFFAEPHFAAPHFGEMSFVKCTSLD